MSILPPQSKFGINRERSAFVFTPEMAYVMGGKGDKPFNDFVELCGKAFNCLRRRGNELINLFRLMIPAGMPELEGESDIQYLVEMLALELPLLEEKNDLDVEQRAACVWQCADRPTNRKLVQDTDESAPLPCPTGLEHVVEVLLAIPGRPWSGPWRQFRV